MSNSISNQVRQIVADVLNEELAAITTETSPKNTASWDSLQHLNIVLALEETFGVQISPEQADTLTSVAAISAFLDQPGA